MKNKSLLFLVALTIIFAYIPNMGALAQETKNNIAKNPVVWADVPDPSVIRVGDTYYMSSTTMHMNPGVPIMKSKDLVNWEIVNYAYDTLDRGEEQALRNGQNEYGQGSWASSLRYHEGIFYLAFASNSTGKTYILQTDDIENGEWNKTTLDNLYHDMSLLFDDDGRVYMVYGATDIRIIELTSDASSIKEGGLDKVLIPDAGSISGSQHIINAEGAHLQKINGKYYVSLISWPENSGRTQLVYRSDSIDGEYEGKVVLQDSGIAQGGMVDTPDGEWYGFLFGDRGSVGRIPYLVPVTWEDDWPVFGVDGKVPEELSITAEGANSISNIVQSDEFYQSYENSNTVSALNTSDASVEGAASSDEKEMMLATQELLDVNNGTELLENGGFEDGQEPWRVNGEATVQVADQEANSGTNSLLVTDRVATGDGPKQVITDKVQEGNTYEFSAQVKYTEGPDQKQFNFNIQHGTSWEGIEVIGSGTVNKGEWGTVEGTYTIPENVDFSETFIFIETPWVSEPDSEVDLLDFYVDDISFVDVTPDPNLIENGGFEEGIDPWTEYRNASIEVTDQEANSGSSSLLVFDRQATVDGPQQDLTNKVVAGGTYEFSAKVKYTEGPDQKGFNFNIQNGPTWETIEVIGSSSITKGEWGTIEGTYTIPADADLSESFIFIETTYADPADPDNDLMDYYVDDVSFTQTSAPEPEPDTEKSGEYEDNGSNLGITWQWNHNPNNNFWSLTDRSGYLRLINGRTSTSIHDSRNTLTQRTFGPESSGEVAIDISNMKNGDVTGLAAFQENYGFVGVKTDGDSNSIVMVNGDSESEEEIEAVEIGQNKVYLKVDFDFKNQTDKAYFYYSLDGVNWTKIGNTLQMEYTIPHFMGYRFALFNYATQETGGYVDFDYFRVDDKITDSESSQTVLNADLGDVSDIVGAPNVEFEVPLEMDALPEGNHTSIAASIDIPKGLTVSGVDFNTDNIDGESTFSYDNHQLKLNVNGDNVHFSNDSSNLFATLKLKVTDFVTEDRTEEIRINYIDVTSNQDVAYNVHDSIANIDLILLDTEALAKIPGFNNPLISHKYGADPNALVYDDRVYIYLTNDQVEYDENGNIIDNNYGSINTITVISSDDMVNWTDHGAIPVAGPDGAATWATNSWAVAVGQKEIDGKDRFLLYFSNNGSGIGVLTADSPIGPWEDPIGEPLIDGSTPGTEGVVWIFDPDVLIDDDGEGYLYYGGGVPGGNNPTQEQAEHPQTARVIKLSDDMIHTEGEAQVIDSPFHFESSGIHKYNGKYYYSYSTNFSGVRQVDDPKYAEIAYMVSDDPMGPFNYVDAVLKNGSEFFGVGGNNHQDFFEFKDQWYITYHAQTLGKALDSVNGYRSPHLNKVDYYDNGNIKDITADMEGVSQLQNLDPFQRNEAETIAWNAGIATEDSAAPGNMIEEVNLNVTDIHDGDWLAVSNIDFGQNGAEIFEANVASTVGGTIELRLDSPVGEVIGTLEVDATGGAQNWKLIETDLSNVSGIHNLFFLFKGDSEGELFNFDYWKFTEADEENRIPDEETTELELGGEGQEVAAGKTYSVSGINANVTMPTDLPAGTKVTVMTKNVEETNYEGLTPAGEMLTFTLEYPDGSIIPSNEFALEFGYNEDAKTDSLAIYYYNEEADEWEYRGGEVNEENQVISLQVSHFSTYGVFVSADSSDGEDDQDGEGGQVEEDSQDGEGGQVEEDSQDGEGGEDGQVEEDTQSGEDGQDREAGQDGDDDQTGKENEYGQELPSTATNLFNYLIFGLLLFILGGITLSVNRAISKNK
ncbi:family 43 glycosylhydrolase [Gracilibacillus suaedae]|uniref:family 43 glycosylhydrolase n=1 Tax=Gracilibacillus suaedae TaxID=2820273 RepID=UPI001E650CD6|nr:family 43 glycosylhydrolase [Gracilibacillus suaedae]